MVVGCGLNSWPQRCLNPRPGVGTRIKVLFPAWAYLWAMAYAVGSMSGPKNATTLGIINSLHRVARPRTVGRNSLKSAASIEYLELRGFQEFESLCHPPDWPDTQRGRGSGLKVQL